MTHRVLSTNVLFSIFVPDPDAVASTYECFSLHGRLIRFAESTIVNSHGSEGTQRRCLKSAYRG
jgi:hypothetical protein